MSKPTAIDIRDALDKTDADSWLQCVGTLVAGSSSKWPTQFRNERERLNGLRLAHAALLYAGEDCLADEVRERIEDAT